MKPKTMIGKAAASSKTTAAAILLAISGLLTAIAAFTDEDPATVPNWSLVITQLVGAAGLFFARDSDKRSEDVGA